MPLLSTFSLSCQHVNRIELFQLRPCTVDCWRETDDAQVRALGLTAMSGSELVRSEARSDGARNRSEIERMRGGCWYKVRGVEAHGVDRAARGRLVRRGSSTEGERRPHD